MIVCEICGFKKGSCPLSECLHELDIRCVFYKAKPIPDDFYLGIVDPSTAC